MASLFVVSEKVTFIQTFMWWRGHPSVKVTEKCEFHLN